MDITSYLLGKSSGGGGSITLQEKTLDVTENGTEIVTADEGYNGLSKVTVNTNVSGGVVEADEKDVNFYDYDGTRLYSYTKNEFLALESLPANPSHEGLTAQGWNWSYADAISYVTEYGMLDVGQTYITDDGATRLYIDIEDEISLKVCLGLKINGSITINWGDNTFDTVTSSNIDNVVNTTHNYAELGKYIISIQANNEQTEIRICGNTSLLFSYLLTDGTSNITSSGTVSNYFLILKKVELGSNMTILDTGAFANFSKMETITIPKNIQTLKNRTFYRNDSLIIIIFPDGTIDFVGSFIITELRNLKRLILSNSITTLTAASFNAVLLDRFIIPTSITSVGTASAFNGIIGLTKLTVPTNINNIPDNTFGYNYSIRYYDFTHFTSVPTCIYGAFSQIQSYTKIVVPDNLYSSWRSASGWSSYSSYIIKASEA